VYRSKKLVKLVKLVVVKKFVKLVKFVVVKRIFVSFAFRICPFVSEFVPNVIKIGIHSCVCAKKTVSLWQTYHKMNKV